MANKINYTTCTLLCIAWFFGGVALAKAIFDVDNLEYDNKVLTERYKELEQSNEFKRELIDAYEEYYNCTQKHLDATQAIEKLDSLYFTQL